jgi:hypothetical protein
MGGVGLLVRAELRRRWLALVLVGLLTGAIGAAVVTSVAGARRSATAYDRLAELTGQPDATLLSLVGPRLVDEALGSPEVETAWPFRSTIGQVLDAPTVVYLGVVAGPERPPGLFTPRYETGRPPADDAPHEVAVDDGLADQADLAVGDRLPMAFLTQEELSQFDSGFGMPDGPQVDLEVVGTFSVAGNETSETVGVLASPAFAEVSDGAGGAEGAMLDLVDDRGAEARFAADVREAAADEPLPEGGEELGAYDLRLAQDDRDRSRASARVVANGLLLAGAIGLVVGLLGLAQTVVRHQSRALGGEDMLRALGQDRRARATVSVLPFAIVAAPIAAVVTVAGAIALSPLLPIGAARRIEPSPGVEVNLVVLTLGALAVVLLLLGVIGAVVAHQVRRPAEPPRHVPSSLAKGRLATLPFPVAVGAAFALDPGRRRGAAPVRAALVGGVLAIAAAVGAAAFAVSLDRLVDTPSRYGSPGDALIADVRSNTVARLLTDPDVDAVLEARGFDLEINGTRQDAFSTRVLKGSIGFNELEGRAPAGPAEVALGPALADRLDAEVGDLVTLGDAGDQATVVGIVLARGDTGNSYAESAVVDDDLRQSVSEGSGFREAIVRYADGVDADAAVAQLSEELEVERIEPPIRIRDLAQVRRLPLILAGAAALLGVVLLGHALVVTVRRRGRDLALLRALGARPAQTAVSVVVMTVILVVAGVVLGVPLGFFLANLAWRAVADSLYVADDLAVPVLVTLLCLPVALVVGLLAAAVPTYRAGRLEVAEQLRRE